MAQGCGCGRGGDISQDLTPFMDSDFWRPPAVAPASEQGNPDAQHETGWGHGFTQSAQWAEFVLFPNNWLFDTNTKSWWQMADREDFIIHKWATDWRGYMAYGAPSGFNSSQDPAFYEFDINNLRSDYSWQSQPIAQSINKDIRLKEVIWTGTGRGRVKISAVTAEHAEPVVLEINEINAPNRCVSVRGRLPINGTSCELRIESFAVDDITEAPTTNSLKFSYSFGSSIAKDA